MSVGLMWLWMATFWIGVVLLAVGLAALLFPRVPPSRAPSPRETVVSRSKEA